MYSLVPIIPVTHRILNNMLQGQQTGQEQATAQLFGTLGSNKQTNLIGVVAHKAASK